MNNQEFLRRSLAAVWHPCTQMKNHETQPLIPIARGDGAWLIDFEGKRYLDAVSSWWVNLFGHGNPRINAAPDKVQSATLLPRRLPSGPDAAGSANGTIRAVESTTTTP